MAQIIAGGTKPDSGGNVEVITQTQTTTWTQLQGKPYILVSSKGIVNGLSNIPNDGADFGPDTTKGATAPGQYGSPYTQSEGIGDAWNYAFAQSISIGFGGQPVVHLLEGTFYLNENVTIAGSTSVKPNVIITGSGKRNTWVFVNNSGGNGIVFSPSTLNDIYMSDLSLHASVSVNTMLNYDSSSNTGNQIVLSDMYVTAADTVTTASLYIWNTGALIMYDIEYNTPSSGGITARCNSVFYFINSTGAGNLNVQGDSLIASIMNVYWATSSNTNNVWQFGGTDTTDATVNINASELPSIVYINGNLEILKITGCTNQSGMPNNEQFQSTATSAVIKHFVFKDNFYGGVTTANNLFSSAITTDWADTNSIIYDSASTKTLTLPVNVPSTPSVPASGTAEENTNPYAVDVYVYGGAVTEIQITRNGTAYTVFSVSTAIAMSGQAYKLNPGDSITVTYSTAPSWEWLSD